MQICERPDSLAALSLRAGVDLAVALDLTLRPQQFLPQASRPQVAGLWLLPSSEEAMLVSLRKLSSRSQWRQTVQPGQCLLFGPLARQHWALAVPPILTGGGARVRRVRVLAAGASSTAWAAELQPSLYALPLPRGDG